ncbi:MAG: hypothetical protein ACYDDE_00520 [bacterium]
MSAKFYRAQVITEPFESFGYSDNDLINFLEKRTSNFSKLGFEDGQGLIEIPIDALKEALESDSLKDGISELKEFIEKDIALAQSEHNSYVTYLVY